MAIELKMPALSPTMEEGTLAKWLVKAGDTVKSGDILAEIETDKATMEFESIDEGVIGAILIPEGTEGVKVGTVIATIGEGDVAGAPAKAKAQGVPLTELFDTLQTYLREIRRAPLFSPQEEYATAVRARAGDAAGYDLRRVRLEARGVAAQSRRRPAKDATPRRPGRCMPSLAAGGSSIRRACEHCR